MILNSYNPSCDANRGISTIGYDLGGHPVEIAWTNGNATRYVG